MALECRCLDCNPCGNAVISRPVWRTGTRVESKGFHLPDRVLTNGVYRLSWFEDYYDADTEYPNFSGRALPGEGLRYDKAFAAGQSQ